MSNGEGSTGLEVKGSAARADSLAIQVGDTGYTMAGLAEVFVQSGFFKDVKGQAQAIVKVLYGKELGLREIQSMLAIHMVEGRPEVAAATLGALVKRSGRYDYRVKEHTAEVCEIEFFEVHNGTKESVGISRWDQSDTAMAGLATRPNHKAYPKAMKFARAMSQGVRWYCLDAIGAVPVYAEGEVREEREAAGEVLDTTAEDVTPANPFASNKKEASPVAAQGDQAATAPQSARAPVEETAGSPAAGDPPKARKPRATKSAAAGGENPGGDFGASGAPAAAESTDSATAITLTPSDPICPNVRLADGVRCSGPVGHDGECLYVVAGAEDCPTSGCWAGAGHGGEHVFEPQEAAPALVGSGGSVAPSGTATAPAEVAPDVEPGPQTFYIGNSVRQTAGMTESQFRDSIMLGSQLDKDSRYTNKSKWPHGYSRELLRRMLGLADAKDASRNNLTKAQGEQYLNIQRAAVAAGAPQQAEIAK